MVTVQDAPRTRNDRDSRIERAVAKALEQARAGNLPTLLRQYDDHWETCQIWSIGSRTSGGTVYLIDLEANADGLTTHCSCAAGDEDRICWHRAACRLAACCPSPRPSCLLRPAATAGTTGRERAQPSTPPPRLRHRAVRLVRHRWHVHWWHP